MYWATTFIIRNLYDTVVVICYTYCQKFEMIEGLLPVTELFFQP